MIQLHDLSKLIEDKPKQDIRKVSDKVKNKVLNISNSLSFLPTIKPSINAAAKSILERYTSVNESMKSNDTSTKNNSISNKYLIDRSSDSFQSFHFRSISSHKLNDNKQTYITSLPRSRNREKEQERLDKLRRISSDILNASILTITKEGNIDVDFAKYNMMNIKDNNKDYKIEKYLSDFIRRTEEISTMNYCLKCKKIEERQLKINYEKELNECRIYYNNLLNAKRKLQKMNFNDFDSYNHYLKHKISKEKDVDYLIKVESNNIKMNINTIKSKIQKIKKVKLFYDDWFYLLIKIKEHLFNLPESYEIINNLYNEEIVHDKYNIISDIKIDQDLKRKIYFYRSKGVFKNPDELEGVFNRMSNNGLLFLEKQNQLISELDAFYYKKKELSDVNNKFITEDENEINSLKLKLLKLQDENKNLNNLKLRYLKELIELDNMSNNSSKDNNNRKKDKDKEKIIIINDKKNNDLNGSLSDNFLLYKKKNANLMSKYALFLSLSKKSNDFLKKFNYNILKINNYFSNERTYIKSVIYNKILISFGYIILYEDEVIQTFDIRNENNTKKYEVNDQQEMLLMIQYIEQTCLYLMSKLALIKKDPANYEKLKAIKDILDSKAKKEKNMYHKQFLKESLENKKLSFEKNQFKNYYLPLRKVDNRYVQLLRKKVVKKVAVKKEEDINDYLSSEHGSEGEN